jgi:hypothetical protein
METFAVRARENASRFARGEHGKFDYSDAEQRVGGSSRFQVRDFGVLPSKLLSAFSIVGRHAARVETGVLNHVQQSSPEQFAVRLYLHNPYPIRSSRK